MPRMSSWCMAIVTCVSMFSSTFAIADDAGQLATRILQETGVRGGLVVHLGCGDGKLTAALHAADSFLVHGLDTDAARVAAARQYLHSTGLYGKVSADRLTSTRLPYAENLVNLLVAEQLGDVSMDEVLRVLCPRGVAYVKTGGDWKKTVKPWPDEIDEWTHYLYDASNNAVSHDTVVGPPERYQWIAGPRWARSHDHLSTVSAMVSAGGRIFYIIDEGPTAVAAIQPRWRLVARDAFNGVLLWKLPVDPWEGHLRDFRTGPTELARRLVAVGDRVYVTLGYGKPVTALDAASGATVRTYDETAGAMEIIHHDGRLLVVVGDRLPDNTAGAAKPVEPTHIWHWWPIYEDKPPKKHLLALDADSGDVIWKKSDRETVQMMPSTLCASGDRVYFENQEAIVAMDGSTGGVRWSAERPISRHRSTWSTPTLVIYGDVLLSGDRAVGAPIPDMVESPKDDQWVVNSHGGDSPTGLLIGFSATTGERLWESDARECYNAPVDVLVADDLVWSGNLVGKRDPGITSALDVKTGEVRRQRPADQTFFDIRMGHHRCYRNKATEKYLVLGRDGIELIDLKTGEGVGNAWVRGSCQYGVMPSGGLIYAPPHSCACHIESKLNSFNALATQSGERKAESGRLEKGPAYATSPRLSTFRSPLSSWPTYRGDGRRSGAAKSPVQPYLKPAWRADLGGRLSSPVVVDGRVFVASIDEQTVHAIDMDGGELLWSFTAGGRVDSPPTIHAGKAIFGSADGWIYCVNASDGELAWRFRAAPNERRIIAYGQLESAWPVHGSVLVEEGTVYAVAGRTTHLDGGMTLYRLDATSGEMLSETPITADALPDILSCDGSSVFLRHLRFDKAGVEQAGLVPHLYSPAGFLDDSWWHRTYWMFGDSMRSGWGAWPNSGTQTPAGRLMVLDDSTIYGYGRFNQYHRDGTHVGLGKTQYVLYRSDQNQIPDDDAARRRASKPGPNEVTSRWSQSIPLLARGMVLAGETLFVAGPPDVFEYAPEESTDPYHITSPEALEEQQASLDGERGGLLLAISTEDGRKMTEYQLDAPPVWDGLIAAAGRVFIATTAGELRCWLEK